MIERNKKIVFFIPCAGQIHQLYLKLLYDGIECCDKFIVTYYKHKGGWCDVSYKCVTLYPENLVLKIFSKIKRKISAGNGIVSYPPVGYLNKINKVNRDEDIDLIHFVYAGGAAGFIPFLRDSNVRFTVNFAGSDVQVAEQNPWYMENLVWLWDHAACCTFASNFLMQQALRKGCPKEKAKVMYLGTSLDVGAMDFVAPARDFVQYISVGNLLEVKGHKYLIESLGKVKHSFTNCRLVIVGEGPERTALELLIQNLQLGDSVLLTGTLDKSQVNKLFLESDICVQPSVRARNGDEEGFSQATIEAMAAKLPVIVFDSGALTEIISDSHNGFVVSEKNTNALASRMVELATDLTLRQTISRNGYATVCDRFSIGECNKKWNTFFDEILNGSM